MKVLLLADSLGNGGAERQLALLATSFPPECQVRVWAMGGGYFEAHLMDRGVPVAVRPRRFRLDPSPAAALLRELRSWRPDVVHAWGWMSALAATTLCHLLGTPVVNGIIRSGAMDPDCARLRRLGLATSTLVIANSHAGLAAWNVSASKGRVVYNGFDRSRLAVAGEAVRPSGSPFTVVMTGRMTPVKDYDVVLAAARLLSRESGSWRFLLVGDGPDRERLGREANDLLVARVVEFPQPGTEVLALVRESDVGVLMTNPRLATEGLSNSIMEYMALGLPVVCGEGGGNPELVLDGVTGFIVPPADPGSLADRLMYLRTHADKRREMGAAGRARILSSFSVAAMVDGMLSVYAEATTRVGRAR